MNLQSVNVGNIENKLSLLKLESVKYSKQKHLKMEPKKSKYSLENYKKSIQNTTKMETISAADVKKPFLGKEKILLDNVSKYQSITTSCNESCIGFFENWLT